MWIANTDSWTLETGTSIWLIGDATTSYPPNGIDLPITLVSDGAVVMSTVISASSSEIVIELGGYRRRMTPTAPRAIACSGAYRRGNCRPRQRV